MSVDEVLYMVHYCGDLSEGWRDYICSGSGAVARSKEELISGALEYLDNIDHLAKEAFDEIDDEFPFLAEKYNDDDLAREEADELKYEISRYVERAKMVDRVKLADLLGSYWDESRQADDE